MADFDNITPKKIGNFNIPKNLIECKVDTLAFLEILLRKNICTWEEIEEIREVVVMHMNVMFPDLQLSYTTPLPLKDQGPLTPPDEPKKPLYYNAPPPEMDNVDEVKKPMHVNPLYQNVQPPKVMNSFTKSSTTPKPISNQIPNVTSQANAQRPATPAINQAQPNTQQTTNTSSNPTTPAQQNDDNLPKGNFSTPSNPKPLPTGPRPMMPSSGLPKILNNPPRKNI